MLNKLNDQELAQTYQLAREKKLEREFIALLREEMQRRKTKLPSTDQERLILITSQKQR